MHLYIRPHFYYEMEIEGNEYTSHPTDDPVVERMLQSHPDYWLKNQPTRVDRKKTLILTDWTLQYSLHKTRAKATLLELLTEGEQGFEILVWKNRVLTPLTKETLDDFFIEDLSSINVSYKEEIEQAIKDKELNPKYCVLLDHYELSQLHSDEEQDYFIHISDIRKVKDKEFALSCLRSFAGDQIKVIYDELSKNSMQEKSLQGNFFKSVTISHAYNKLCEFEITQSQLRARESIELKKAEFSTSITWEDLSKLEEIDLKNADIAPKDILTLLDSCLKLKKLSLLQYKRSFDQFDLSDKRYNQVEEVNFSHTDISGKELANWLKALPSLRKIELERCNDLCDFSQLSLYDIRHERVEEINLNFSGLHDQGLENLLTAFPNLKKLSISQNELSCEGINRLFAAFPKLKELNLSSRHGNLPSASNFDRVIYQRVERLNLSSGSISNEDVKTWLEAFPNLRELDLSYCSNLSDALDLDGIQHQQIKKIFLKTNGVSNKTLKAWLAACPNLKQIFFALYKGETNLFDLGNMQYPQVEEIRAFASNVSSQGIVSLLKAFPNLKKLDLSNCEGISDLFISDNIQHEQVEEIKLSGTKVTNRDVTVLLRMFPNLKKLDVSMCYGLDMNFNLDDLQHHSIQEINLAHNHISSKAVEDLSKVCPNLKGLDTVQIIDNERPTPPQHNVSQHQNSKNPPPFVYDKTKNRTLSQKMLINQLSQYLLITQQKNELIQHIQSGICADLSRLFLKHQDKWQNWLKTIQKWDGCIDSLTEDMESIFSKIIKQINSEHMDSEVYLGDYVKEFLQQYKGSLVLYNPWHGIAIFYDEITEQWHFYDPNDPRGKITLLADGLYLTVNRHMGELLFTYNITPLPADSEPTVIEDKNAFLADGGFLLLARLSHINLLKYCQTEPMIFSPQALDGLLHRDAVACKPAWAHGLVSSHAQDFFRECIKQFIAQHPQTYQQQLANSLSELPEEESTHFLSLVLPLARDVEFKQVEEPVDDQPMAFFNQKPRATRPKLEKLIAKYRALFPVTSSIQVEGEEDWLEHALSQSPQKILLQTHGANAQRRCLLDIYRQAKQHNILFFSLKALMTYIVHRIGLSAKTIKVLLEKALVVDCMIF